ncbi:MAG: TraB/GumN family protein [Erythrobacter sp.]
MKLRSLLRLTAAFGALLGSSPAFAEAHAEASVEATLPSGPEGPALWQVADEDTTIYLFGTIHALDPSVVWYDAEIDAALASSDTVVTELLMDPESEAAMQQLAVQRGAFTDGTSLRSLLDGEQTAAYEAMLAGLGIPAAAFDQLEPWLAGLTLTMLPLMQQGYNLEAGVDKVILSKAGDKSKDALETAEFQLGIFDNLPQDAQIEFLMAAVENADEVKPTLDRMVAEWIAGDADGLAAIMNEDMDEDEALAEQLLYDRNANWAEWIEARLDQPGTVFIAVGAGHLAGDLSVQDYLAKHGIETTRIQ